MQTRVPPAKSASPARNSERAKEEERHRSGDGSLSGRHLSHGNILKLQAAAGNRATVEILAHRAIAQRALDLTLKWTATEKAKYEGPFNELEKCIGALSGKPEASNKKFRELVAIFNRYNNKPTPRSTEVVADLQQIVSGIEYAKNLAKKYVELEEPAAEVEEGAGDSDEENEIEGDESSLLALAGGSHIGKKIVAEQAQQAIIKKQQAAAAKASAETEAYYASFTQSTARSKLNEWVRSEATRMIKEINDAFAIKPETYGSVLYSQPDSRLLGIAGRTSATVYEQIADKIKAEFRDRAPSHIAGYFYHRTKSSTKGAGGFNITGWKATHDTTDVSPFNMHVVH